MPGNPDLVPGTGASTWDSIGFYANRYEIKSDYGWMPFIQAQLDLKNGIDTLWDVDRALWMFAFNNVYVNLDSYTGSFAQNYYLYQDEYLKFNSMVWDINMCFGGFTQLSQGMPLNYTGMQQMTPLAQSTNTSRPLISKLISQPRYKKQYIAHMKTMLEETIGNNQYYTLGTQMINLIDADVLADSLKFYSYNSFKNNLDTSVVMAGNSQRIGIKQLMAARYNFLMAHVEFSYAQPIITQITQSNNLPNVQDSITITAKISNANYAYLGLKNDQYDHFTRLQMFDDGLHGDGIAGDSIYGIKIKITTSVTYYYLYAENNNAGIFSPLRAEHEFYTIQANIPAITKQALVVNECMALNTKTINSPLGKPVDWIEIKNTSSTTIPLYGLYLTDDTANMTKWAFPPNTNIEPGKYLIVWCDEEKSANGLHANFKLSSQGEKIYLTNTDKSIVDSCFYGPLKADVSYGRCPENGSNYLNMIYPTPLQSNKCDTAVLSSIPTIVSDVDLMIYPNPASHQLNVQGLEEEQTTLYNISGYAVLSTRESSFSIEHLANGIYFVVQPNKNPAKLIVQKE